MGLLDNLYIGHNANFGGQGGGLLDFLRTTQMQQQNYQPSAGFQDQQAAPMPIGGYQMPRIGDQAQFTPPQADPATLPSNAQPAQGVLPQAPQQPQETGFGDRLMAGFQGFANAGGPLQALSGGISGLATGSNPQNQTAQYLVSKGIDPALAKTIASDPATLRTILPQLTGFGRNANQPAKVQEYLFAKQEDPTLTYAKFLQKERSTNEYGMQPMYTVNNGKTEAWQLGKDGKPIRVELPPGSEIARGTETIKTPTHVITRDKQSGLELSREKIDNAGKASDEVVGEAQGKARAALANGADIDAAATIKKIDEFASSKGFNEVFGQLDQYRPSWTHSNEGADALARYKQLKGTAFLSAYSMLKGGGAITDIEGQKAGDAMARLDRAQGEAEAKAALRDFREAVQTGLDKLKRAAGGGATPSASTSTSTAAPQRIRLNADGTIAQ